MSKKIVIILIISLIGALLLTSCQPTPEKEFVSDKRGSVDLMATQQPTVEPKVSDSPEVEATPTDEKTKVWTDTFKTSDGQSTININAEILDTKAKLPIVSVVPKQFSEERIEEIATIIFKGKPIYKYECVRLKSDIEEDIVEIKLKISEIQKLIKSGAEIIENKDGSKSVEVDKYTRIPLTNLDDYNKWLESFNKELKQAPEKYPNKTPMDFKYKDTGDMMSEHSNGRMSTLYFVKYKKTNYNFMRFDGSKSYRSTDEKANEEDIGISLDEATDIADKIICKIGLADMSIQACLLGEGSVDKTDKCYAFYYTRKYNNVSQTYIREFHSNAKDSEIVATPVDDEVVEVIVDKDGVQRIYWKGNCETLKVINDNAKIISISKMKEVAKEHLKMKFSNSEEDIVNTVNVEKAVLGLYMMQELDSKGKYLMVPVWDLIGTYKMCFGDEISGVEYDSPHYGLLTINALDGSVIDRRKGY